MNYVKENLAFVNVVMNLEDADIQLLFSSERTGSGGIEKTIIFVGMHQFENMFDTLHYFYDPLDPVETKRAKYLTVLKKGLLPFILKSPLKENIVYSINGEHKKTDNYEDPWDNWVFRTKLSGYFEGEEASTTHKISANASARRVTEQWKFLFMTFGDYKEQNFDYDEYHVKDVFRSYKFKTFAIKSITNHWSVGTWSFISTSSYNNLRSAYGLSTGIEYNYFPYSEYNNRQFRIEYKFWLKQYNYLSETVFFKNEELLVEEELSLVFDLINSWGDLTFYLSGSNYMHDTTLNSFSFASDISINLFKGLSLDLNFNISAINDQLTLPIGNASLEEILLQQRMLATEFQYSGSIGFAYYFGSIYNYIVNTRFGD